MHTTGGLLRWQKRFYTAITRRFSPYLPLIRVVNQSSFLHPEAISVNATCCSLERSWNWHSLKSVRRSEGEYCAQHRRIVVAQQPKRISPNGPPKQVSFPFAMQRSTTMSHLSLQWYFATEARSLSVPFSANCRFAMNYTAVTCLTGFARFVH